MPTTIRTTSPNVDSGGTRQVRKGCIVEFTSGARARVTWVRNGQFATDITHHVSKTPCSGVKVVNYDGNHTA